MNFEPTLFKAPSFTEELVQAIKLISPQFGLSIDERSRLFWEEDQNGACWGEYKALAPLFKAMPKPKKVLEIGPGLGRSVVFFYKKLGWEKSEIAVYEGEGNKTKYTILGPRFEDSFCGNFAMLQKVLSYNGLNNIILYDAAKIALKELPGPYDFIYSFYAIGFHWSLEHFLPDIAKLMHDKSIAVFTVPNNFAPFSQLEDFYYKIIDWQTMWPKAGSLKLLILSNSNITSA